MISNTHSQATQENESAEQPKPKKKFAYNVNTPSFPKPPTAVQPKVDLNQFLGFTYGDDDEDLTYKSQHKNHQHRRGGHKKRT